MAMVRCCDADRGADGMSIGGLVDILMKMQFNEVLVPPHVKSKLYTKEVVTRTVRRLLEDHSECQIQAQGYQLIIDSIFPPRQGLSCSDKAGPAPLRASSPPRLPLPSPQLRLCGENAFQRRLGRLRTTSTISGMFEEEKDEAEVEATTASWLVDENELDTGQGSPEERRAGVKQVEEGKVDLVERDNREEVEVDRGQHQEKVGSDPTQEERREPTGTCGEQEQELGTGNMSQDMSEEGEIKEADSDSRLSNGEEDMDVDVCPDAARQSSGSAEPVADIEVYDIQGRRLLGGTSWSVIVAGVPKGSSTAESLQELAESTLVNFEFVSGYKHFVRGVTICEGREDDSAIIYFCSELVSEMFLQVCQHDFQISGKKLGFARNFTPTSLIGRIQGPVIYLSRIPKHCNRNTLISHFTNIVRGDSGDVKASQDIVKSADIFPATTDGYLELVGHWAVDLVFYRCKKNVKLLEEVGPELCMFRGNSYVPQRRHLEAEVCRNGEKNTETGVLEAAIPDAFGVKRHATDLDVQRECKRHKHSPSAVPKLHAEDRQQDNKNGTSTSPTTRHSEQSKRQTRFDRTSPARNYALASITPPPGFENYFQSDIGTHSSPHFSIRPPGFDSFRSDSGIHSSPGIRPGSPPAASFPRGSRRGLSESSSGGLSPPAGFGSFEDPRQRTLFVYNSGSAGGLEQAVLSLLRSLRQYPVDRDVIKSIRLGEKNTALICFSSEKLADDVMDAYILDPGAAVVDGKAFSLYRHYGYSRPTKNDQVVMVNSFTPSTSTLLGLGGIPSGIQGLALRGAVTELLERLLVYSGFQAQPRARLLTSFRVSGCTAYVEIRSAAELDFLMAVDAPLVLAGRTLTRFRPPSY